MHITGVIFIHLEIRNQVKCSGKRYLLEIEKQLGISSICYVRTRPCQQRMFPLTAGINLWLFSCFGRLQRPIIRVLPRAEMHLYNLCSELRSSTQAVFLTRLYRTFSQITLNGTLSLGKLSLFMRLLYPFFLRTLVLYSLDLVVIAVRFKIFCKKLL